MGALKSFEGGVIIITHSKEFTENLTEEVWAVVDGKMTPSGHNWVQGQGAGPRLKGDDDDEEEKFDAMGNKIVSTKKAKKLTSAELRKKKKDRMARNAWRGGFLRRGRLDAQVDVGMNKSVICRVI